jgi:hypothetical protein
MKTRILQATLTLGLACTASASIMQYYNGTGGSIADWDGVETPLIQTIVSSDPGVVIDGVSLVLNISGGYNGDLYGYLSYNDGVSEKSLIILNRIGGGYLDASGSGFGTASPSITGSTDAERYQSLLSQGVNLTDSGSGNIRDATTTAGNPLAVGNYLADSTATFASTFGGMSASGTWSLLLFDRFSGGQSTLVGWGLEVVPEPTTWAAIIFGTMFAGSIVYGRLRRKPVVAD